MPYTAAVELPRPRQDPLSLLTQPCPQLHGRMISVVVKGAPTAQLGALLREQKPKAVVLTSNAPFGAADVQHLVTVACFSCPSVSIVGSFARVVPWLEVIPIAIRSTTQSFCLLDNVLTGSMHGASIVLFGDLASLKTVSIHADCDVHITGAARPDLRMFVTARSLTFNGQKLSVAPSAPPGDLFQFTNMLHHPTPRHLPDPLLCAKIAAM